MKISVVIPLYNKQECVADTIKSVLAQTYDDYEIVIVDDGSTDASVKFVEEIAGERIRIVRKENGGVGSARNVGVEMARGEYIAFLDADDEWNRDYLQTQVQMIENYPMCSVFACRYSMKYGNGEVRDIILNRMRIDGGVGVLDNYFEVAASSHPPIWTSAVVVRKTALNDVGRFPEGVASGEDLLTWARLAVKYKIAYNKNYVGARFNIDGYKVSERPKRIPASRDYVGDELHKLYEQYKTRGLRLYASHWHKMRCSIYMRLNMRKQSLEEACISLKYNVLNYKVFALGLIAIMPKCIRHIIIK